MISIPHKAKQFLVFTIKLLIVIGAFYFIYDQIAGNSKLEWSKFKTLVLEKTSVLTIIFILLFSVANRYFEILKWQNLVTFIKPISVGEASKQVLGALTLGVFTPVGIGEYAGKALYFPKKQTKKIIFLNLVCNGIQSFSTVIFGIIGLIYLKYYFLASGSILLVIILTLFLYFSREIKIKNYTFQDLIHRLNEIPKYIHRKNFVLAFCRYVIFSHQYYVLFLVFEVDLPYLTLISTISIVYFLSSVVPSFQFLDFAVKGSMAMFFFGKLNVNEWIVIFISTLMWFLNVVLPVVIGSYYVMRFKLNDKKA